MEVGCEVKEEPMSGGDEDQVMEDVEIKQEMLIWVKHEDSSSADPLCEESDVLQRSIGERRSEAGQALMEVGSVVKEEPMSGGEEDQVMEDGEIKQEMLIWVKHEDSSSADPLCEESDVQQESIGVWRPETGPAFGSVVKEEPMSGGEEDQVMEDVEIKQEVLIWVKYEDSSSADPLCEESDVLQGSIGVPRSEAGSAFGCEVKEEPMSGGDEDQVMEDMEIKQEMLIWVKDEDSSKTDPLCEESDVLQRSIGVWRSEAGQALMEVGCEVKEEPMSGGDEDQVMEDMEIKQEMLIWVKDEDSSKTDPLCEESDVLQRSIGERRSEAGQARCGVVPTLDLIMSTPGAPAESPKSLASRFSRDVGMSTASVGGMGVVSPWLLAVRSFGAFFKDPSTDARSLSSTMSLSLVKNNLSTIN
ncbi:hypothetical protein GE061_004524 [Apolygus lucorum]|uniref:Uncharacterized protein n=1 Tax=Apolygus lucorum TaxID=248454 RepID=A0A8S9X231_APOLU|nr:hypothetical protein GE061_004524 [Apolygus lucorum]